MYPSINTIDAHKRPMDSSSNMAIMRHIDNDNENVHISMDTNDNNLNEDMVLSNEATTTTTILHVHNESSCSIEDINNDQQLTINTKKKNESNDPKKDTEAIINSLVHIVEQIMNRQQVIISIVSIIIGIFCIYMAQFRNINNLNYTNIHINAFSLINIMLIYGIFQLLLGIIFLLTYLITSMAVDGGIKMGAQIIIGLLGTLFYLCLIIITIIIGTIGFYKVIQIYNHVDYIDYKLENYIDINLYRSALIIFSAHICFSMAKFCCCCR